MYEGLDFLKAQIDTMRTPNFQSRPNAQIALERWLDTKSKLDVSIARWRLRKRTESVGERALLDTIAAVKSMLNPQVSTSFLTRLTISNNRCFQRPVRTWSNP